MTYRTTSVKHRNWRNRFAWWLYDRWCGEPFIPEGRICVTVTLGNKNPKSPADLRDDTVKIHFSPAKFIPGIHEKYIFPDMIPSHYSMTLIDKRKIT